MPQIVITQEMSDYVKHTKAEQRKKLWSGVFGILLSVIGCSVIYWLATSG